jgi:hypothetical protein
MKEDDKGLAFASGRLGGWRADQVMELKATSEDEEAVMKVEDGF